MDSHIQHFVQQKYLALIGFSRKKTKFGTVAYHELVKRGYKVYSVHPTEKEIDGIECYPNVASLKGETNTIFISISASAVPPLLKEISEAGFTDVWLQQGCESREAVEEADKLGLSLITKKCILMYAEPVGSIHKVHRVIAKVFGKF